MAAPISSETVSHAAILPVLIPMLVAPVCACLRSARLGWSLAVIACGGAFLTAVQLLLTVSSTGTVEYAMGNWPAPWGIAYRIDLVNAGMLVLVSGISTYMLIGGREMINAEIPRKRQSLFFTCWILCTTGLLGITITGDAFNVFVFLEISSLSTYALVSMGKDRRALTAAYRYLIMGTIGATFILIGIGLSYMMTGTLNMTDLAHRLPEVSHTGTVRAAFAFLTVGISLKLALFPMHRWLPNAYTFAPSAVTAFLAATATKVALYLLLRFFFSIFGVVFSYGAMGLDQVLGVLSLLAMLVASTSAVLKLDAKRVLAYSSVAQIGYMTFAVSLGTEAGLGAGILHLFNHALMKGCLFLALGALILRSGSSEMSSLSGLGRRLPWTSAAFIIGAISLIGVPGTVGFISKWHLISAALEVGHWPAVVVMLLTSVLAVLYLGRIIETLYFRELEPGMESVTEVGLVTRISVWIIALSNIFFGLFTDWTIGLAGEAARVLLGGHL